MPAHKVFLGAFALAAGTDSNVLSDENLSMARKFMFDCPATFAGVVTVYVAPKDGALFAACKPLRRFGDSADVTLVAGKMNEVEAGGWESIAIKSAASDTISIPVYAVLEL